MKRFHGARVGALAIPIHVCKVCGAWQLDARGRPIKPIDFYCTAAGCNGTEFHRFPSKAEAREYGSLVLRQRVGEIADLELQPVFKLHAIAPNGAKILIGKYLGDFRFREVKTDLVRVIDTKGADTHMSAWKRKHANAEYGLEITVTQS